MNLNAVRYFSANTWLTVKRDTSTDTQSQFFGGAQADTDSLGFELVCLVLGEGLEESLLVSKLDALASVNDLSSDVANTGRDILIRLVCRLVRLAEKHAFTEVLLPSDETDA